MRRIKPKKNPSPIAEAAFGKAVKINPKQELFLDLYFNPKNRRTFGNAYQSALKAGYTESYARIIAQPGVANQWIEEGRQRMRKFMPEHIIQGIQKEAVNYTDNKGSERLKAYELLAKMQGMLVERSVTAHVNVEQALSELK